MADATTTNLGLTKPEVGASSDTWGTKTNDNMDLIDAAVGALTASPGLIKGATLSAAGGTSTFGVAAGKAVDSTDTSYLILGSAYTKTTSAWTVGSGNGALDTGAIAPSTWYHAYLIKRVDTNVVDILVSLSPTAPTMPTNYTLKRRIGAMKTDGSSHWVAFLQYGNRFIWKSPVVDYNNVTPGGTSATYLTLSVPTGINVEADFTLYTEYVGPGGVWAYAYSPDQTDGTVFTGNFVEATSTACNMWYKIRTDTSGRIRFQVTGTGQKYTTQTFGWTDPLGQW